MTPDEKAEIEGAQVTLIHLGAMADMIADYLQSHSSRIGTAPCEAVHGLRALADTARERLDGLTNWPPAVSARKT